MRRLAGLAALALWLTGCVTAPVAPLPAAPVPAGPAIAVEARPAEPTQTVFGAFAFAGGLVLTSPQTSRLHGLSDMVIGPGAVLTAVSDSGGDLVRMRVVLDGAGRLAGVDSASLSDQANEAGQPLGGPEGDAEGLAVLANGDRLVSFEQVPRILLYPAAAGPPRRAPSPDDIKGGNDGMEALGADPDAGPDAYIVGEEYTGRTWTCRISTRCMPGPTIALEAPQAITSVKPLSGGRRAWLIRAFHYVGTYSVQRVRITDRSGAVLDELVLDSRQVRDRITPQSAFVDNFESLAAEERPDGSVRFYLLSDDNLGANGQRTLLVAFDWRPERR